MKKFFYRVKSFFSSIRNLIIWFNVIWNDRQWDDHYFFAILLKKLEQMEKFYQGPKSHHLGSMNDAENIHYCIIRLNRLINQSYLDEALLPLYEKYPDYNWDLKFEDNGDGSSTLVDNNTEESKEYFRQCGKNADKAEQDDLDELFAHLRLHIQEWWD